MSAIILTDAQFASNLFLWNAPLDRGQIEQWLAQRNWVIPGDLVEFWTITGGGEIFESEKFLPPLGPHDSEDEVAPRTAWHRAHGMPEGLVVFHEGLGFSAIRCADGAYVWFDVNGRSRGEHRSLDDWYTQVLRAEYAERYGLPPLATGP